MNRQSVGNVRRWLAYFLLVSCGSIVIALSTLSILIDEQPTPALVPVATPTAPFDLGVALQQHRIRGEFQQALFLLEARAAQTGWQAQDHALAGNLWRTMGDAARALPHWEAAAQQDPTIDLLRQLAQVHLDDGAWDLAWERLQQILASNPNDAWSLHQASMLIAPHDPALARTYLLRTTTARNRYSDTANRLLVAIGDQLQDPAITLRVGAVLLSLQEWSLAENAFRQVAIVSYPQAEPLAWLAYIRAQRGLDGSAWMMAALTLAPDDANVRYVEGLYTRLLGDLDSSEGALLLALALAPDIPVFYAELGNTYREMGNLTEAEYWLCTAVQISENDVLMQDALDRFYASEAFLLPSEVLALRNVPLAPAQDNPVMQSAEGWALHLIGRSAEGLAQIERALEQSPDNPRIRYDYARILLEIGRVDEALLTLGELAAGNSTYADAAQRLINILN